MLRTAICRSLPASHAFAPAVVAASRRNFMRSAPNMLAALTKQPVDSKGITGTEGPHQSMFDSQFLYFRWMCVDHLSHHARGHDTSWSGHTRCK